MEGGDLLQLQAAEIVQYEDLPVGVLQFPDRLAQPPSALPVYKLLLGAGDGEGQVLVGDVGKPAAAPALPEPGVFPDLAQPGVQAAAALEAVDVEEGLVKCLLQQLLRPVLVAGQGQEEPVDRRSVGFVQLFKSGHGCSSFPMMP